MQKILALFLGGPFNRIFDTVDNALDNETKRQDIRAEAVQRYAEVSAEERADSRRYRMFWLVWALFAVPLGLWWALVVGDTFLTFVNLGIPDLPQSIQPKADVIFGSIFGSGGGVAAMQAISSAIRGRR